MIRTSIDIPKNVDAIEEKRFGTAIDEACAMIDSIAANDANPADTYVFVAILEMLLRKQVAFGSTNVRVAFARTRGLLDEMEEKTRVELYHPGTA